MSIIEVNTFPSTILTKEVILGSCQCFVQNKFQWAEPGLMEQNSDLKHL